MEQDLRATFFPKRQVRLELTDWRPLQSSKDEKRVRMDFTLPLTEKNIEGVLPGWLIAPMNSMDDGGVSTETKFPGLSLDGVTCEFWATPKSPERMQMCTAATLGGFSVKPVARDKEEFPALVFNTTVRANKSFIGWCWEHMGGYLWVEFTPTEPELAKLPDDKAQLQLDTPAEVEEMLESDRVAESEANIAEFFGPSASALSEEQLEGYLREHLNDDPLMFPQGASVEQCERLLDKIKAEPAEPAAAAESANPAPPIVTDDEVYATVQNVIGQLEELPAPDTLNDLVRRHSCTANQACAVLRRIYQERGVEGSSFSDFANAGAREVAEAAEAEAAPAKAKSHGKPVRKPRGFSKPTNPSVN